MAKKQANGNLALEQQRVIVIPAHDEIVARKLRVAAYARVSSSSEDQLNSYRVQNQYYSELISSNPDWEMVDIYADEGITGTSVEKREDFKRMMRDCRKGKIDRILVKSISRFARNTKDCLAAVRELKELGVSVLFEEQGIDTSKVSSEMVTAIMATLAQKQSESISGNVKWGTRVRMQDGTYLPSSLPFGYRMIDKKIQIDSAQAEIVREIYTAYLAGENVDEIAERLNQIQAGSRRWYNTTIRYILSNERYIGDSLWQKTYATDTLPRKQIKNTGACLQYYVEGTHPAIIDKSTYEAVQLLRVKRKRTDRASFTEPSKAFRKRICCGVCGTPYQRKFIANDTYWICRLHNQSKEKCPNHAVPEKQIAAAFCHLYYKLKHHGEPIFTQMLSNLQKIRYSRMLWREDVISLNKKIGVLFEKENINSLPADSEFMITMYGAMAQSESESISGNIRRGRQMHANVGTLKVPCHRLYGYKKDADEKFCIIPEQAKVVREIYQRYTDGASLRNLKDWLEENQIKTVLGKSKWTTTSIKGILTNEKYCGDVLLQKTFCTDVISKKIVKNVGQMTQYYMPDHHEGIVSREQYNAVKAEMARRSALRSPSKTAVTGRSCYTSKYALSDRLVCGECGTLYRRCTWTSLGRKYPVWRCTSRLNYGTKYCHDSPTIKEEPLQAAILEAINAAMSDKSALLNRIKNAVSLELLPVQGQTMSLADIEHRLVQLDEQFQSLLAEAIDAEDKEACNAQFAEILTEQTSLKKQKETIQQSSADVGHVCTRMKQAEQAIESAASTITEWNENAVRQIVERVTVLSADEVLVRIKGGAEIKQRLER